MSDVRVDIRTVDGGNVEVRDLVDDGVLELLRAFETREDEYGSPQLTVRIELDGDEQTSIALAHVVRIDVGGEPNTD